MDANVVAPDIGQVLQTLTELTQRSWRAACLAWILGQLKTRYSGRSIFILKVGFIQEVGFENLDFFRSWIQLFKNFGPDAAAQ